MRCTGRLSCGRGRVWFCLKLNSNVSAGRRGMRALGLRVIGCNNLLLALSHLSMAAR